MVLEIKKCRNCGKSVAKLNGEWWHYVEIGGTINHPKDGIQDVKQINFNKAQLLEIKNVKCKECGSEKHDIDYCFKPEPFNE